MYPLELVKEYAEIAFKSNNYPKDLRVMKRIYGDNRTSALVLNKRATLNLIIMTMLRAQDSGLSPMTGLFTVIWYNDRPCLNADVALAMVQSSPKYLFHSDEYNVETRTATVTFHRDAGDSTSMITRSFSWDDAVKANLAHLDHYKKYGERMLMIRARSWAMRDLFADALNGLSIAEEQRDIELVKKLTPVAEVSGDIVVQVVDEFTAAAMEKADQEEKPDFTTLKSKPKKAKKYDLPPTDEDITSPSLPLADG